MKLIKRCRGKMEVGGASSSVAVESKAGFVLGNVAEVVEKILTFVPTKSVFRIARYCVQTRLLLVRETVSIGTPLAS